jgi:hypothetical protein
LKTQSEGERREKGKEVGSTSIPFSHSPLIGYFYLLNSIGLNLNILFILPFVIFLLIMFWTSDYTVPTNSMKYR